MAVCGKIILLEKLRIDFSESHKLIKIKARIHFL